MSASSSASNDGTVPKDNDALWFSKEVHPHGGQLKCYLKGHFPAVRDVDDVVQESFLRLWKARTVRPIHSAKAFLFKVARHVALDLIRRERISPVFSAGDLSSLSVIEERPDAAEALTEREIISLLGDAVVALPARTRAIIILHKFQGLSQVEVARQFGLTAKAVEHQVARGVQLCEKYLRARGYDFL
ncbi:MAG: sigma-70 family RNA polymerase sigma factor [Opitutaceae bacterium]|nr:sigma-70 family RNA polymerase sigma factor [Opitutaceae bacterium]